MVEAAACTRYVSANMSGYEKTSGAAPPDRRRLLGWLSLAAAAAVVPRRAPAAADEGPVIAAASNLRFALEAVTEAFRADTGHRLRLSYGASGNLARQIRQGAPFELFLSADELYVRRLVRAGLTRGGGTLYAVGRLVIAVPPGSPVAADGSLDGLARALDAGQVTRFAIANPAHAPYGKRAEEALRHRGLWRAIEPKLVLGENVSQAAQFAVSGNAEGGLIPYSLALAPTVSNRASFDLVPEAWHSPLRQSMALLKGAGPVAAELHDYLQRPRARAILARHGFSLPGGAG